MKMFSSADFRNIILLTLAAVLAMVLFGQLPSTTDYTTLPDSSWYLRTAEAAPNLDLGQRQPFGFRLLGPYLIGLLPISAPLGFRIFTVILTFCFVFLSYYVLRYVGLSPLVSLVSVVLVLLNRYVFGHTFWSVFLVNDFLMMIFILVMFLAMWKNQWLVFSVTLVLGAMTREPTMVMVPVALFYLWERKDQARWRTVILACIPGLLTLLAIRLFVPISEGTPLIEALATYSRKLIEPRSLFRLLVNTFLPFTLIPLVYFRTTVDFFRTRKYLLVFIFFVFCTTLFGSNQERLMIPTFIVFFMLLGTILESVKGKALTFSILIAAGFLSSFHYNFGNWQLPGPDWTRALTLGSALLVTVYMIFVKRNSRAQLQKRKGDKLTHADNIT